MVVPPVLIAVFIVALYVIGSFALVGNTLMERPTESIAGLGLVALGLPFYVYWTRRRS